MVDFLKLIRRKKLKNRFISVYHKLNKQDGMYIIVDERQLELLQLNRLDDHTTKRMNYNEGKGLTFEGELFYFS